MTAALPLLIPGLPPGTGPARPAQSAASSDLAGLFALLLAGQQPVPATMVEDAGSSTPAAPALAPTLLAGGAPTVPTTPAAQPTPPMAGASGPAAAVTLPPTAPALPAIPAPAHALLDSDGPPPQPALAPQDGRASAPVAIASAGPTRAAPPPPLTVVGDPHPHPDRARGGPALPLAHTGAIVTRSTIARSPAVPTESTAARPEVGTIAPATDAKPSAAPSGASLQAGAPAHLAGPAPMQPTTRAPAAHGRTVAAPASEARRAHPALLAPASSSPRATATEPAASDASDPPWLEAGREAEGVVSRSEHAMPDPTRAQAPGRPAPPAPVLQIGVHIARAVPARIDRLVVQLEPAALGRVEVRLKFHRDDQVSAVIAAERPDTLDALQRDARLLERGLHQAGLRLDSDGLTFSLKREQAHHQAPEDPWFAPSAGGVADQPLPAAHNQALLHWFQGLRALDIRV
jgi:hypothetical protein